MLLKNCQAQYIIQCTLLLPFNAIYIFTFYIYIYKWHLIDSLISIYILVQVMNQAYFQCKIKIKNAEEVM